MTPADVPAELVEKAARAVMDTERIPGDISAISRIALAAVLPEIQAQALRDAADEMRRRDDHFSWDEIHRGSEWLDERAARLTATTEGPTT